MEARSLTQRIPWQPAYVILRQVSSSAWWRNDTTEMGLDIALHKDDEQIDDQSQDNQISPTREDETRAGEETG